MVDCNIATASLMHCIFNIALHHCSVPELLVPERENLPELWRQRGFVETEGFRERERRERERDRDIERDIE